MPRITMLGTLTDDPELYFTNPDPDVRVFTGTGTDQPVSTFLLAVPATNHQPVTGGHGDPDQSCDHYRVTVSNALAEAIAARLSRDDRVVVIGEIVGDGTETWYGVRFPVRLVDAVQVSVPFWMAWPGWATTSPVPVEIVDERVYMAGADRWRLRSVMHQPGVVTAR